MRLFDRTFGPRFLASVPAQPGVYRLYDAEGALLYVGKAGDLRRRLAQYRTTRRIKRDAKRRALVRSAARIAWDVCASETEAALLEIRLIQALRPRENVTGAFPFLYPFIGLAVDGHDTHFGLATSPDALPAFELHGAFRSRRVTGEAFFALMRLLRFVGHLTPRPRRAWTAAAPRAYVRTFRRLPGDWPPLCARLLRGASLDALECLTLRLLEQAGARARRARVQEDLRAVQRFYDEEAAPLAAAIAVTGYPRYPVPQEERDALLLRFRRLPRTYDGGHRAPLASRLGSGKEDHTMSHACKCGEAMAPVETGTPFTADLTVAQAARDPEAKAALQRLGIDQCCGGAMTLAEAAAAAGMPVGSLLRALSDAAGART